MMIYQFSGRHWSGVRAQDAGERLAQIRMAAGILTAEQVVLDATDEESPLHNCFEWNDGVAAYNWRCEEARVLCRSIVIIPEEEGNGSPIRAFVAVDRGTGQKDYTPIHVALCDPITRQELLQEALAELNRWRAKYAHYTEFANLLAVIEQEEDSLVVAAK